MDNEELPALKVAMFIAGRLSFYQQTPFVAVRAFVGRIGRALVIALRLRGGDTQATLCFWRRRLGHGDLRRNRMSQHAATMSEWDRSAQILRRSLEAGGAFLLTQTPDGRTNPMTIGWAQLGIIWNRPICTVFVRKSRYSYGCITNAREFVVSVPFSGELRGELAVCGSTSGREIDKIRETGLPLVPGRVIGTPVIKDCDLQIECRTVASTQMLTADLIADDVRESFYSEGDEHLVVFGEIVAMYRTDSKPMRKEA